MIPWDGLRVLAVLVVTGSATMALSIAVVFLVRWRACPKPTKTSDLLILTHVMLMTAYVVGTAIFVGFITVEHLGDPPSWRVFVPLTLHTVLFIAMATMYQLQLWLRRSGF